MAQDVYKRQGVACGADDVRSLWPKVLRVPRVVQMGAEWFGLNDTDRFILRTLWQQPERLSLIHICMERNVYYAGT